MFLVFHKAKIYSYAIAVFTVIVLFLVATSKPFEETVQTSSNPSRKLPIYAVETEEKKVAFTMNCAWNADDIDSILETLKKCNIKITFFLVGDWVDKYPEAVKKIQENGHEIANHSDSHPHVNELNLEKNKQEIEECSKKIEEITGIKPSLYRGPYGEYNDTVISAAESLNYKTIQWSLDTLDYSGLTGDQMWNRLDSKIKPGDIILSHNGTKHTSDSLEMLLTKIQEKGYQIVKVSDLIYPDNSIIDINGVQKRQK